MVFMLLSWCECVRFFFYLFLLLLSNRKMKCIWIWFWTMFLRRSTEWPDTTAEPNRLCLWFMSRYIIASVPQFNFKKGCCWIYIVIVLDLRSLPCYHVCVFLFAVVHVPVVPESGLHPFVWYLPSGHQTPELTAGSRDSCAQTVRFWQVRHSVHILSCVAQWSVFTQSQ